MVKLDELILVLTSVACCAFGLFERGLLVQSAAFITVLVAAFRFDPAKVGAGPTAFYPAAGARIIVPLLLIAERVYQQRYLIGHNPTALWAALVWVWCSATYEATGTTTTTTVAVANGGSKKQEAATTTILGVELDSNRLSLTCVYAITTTVAFTLLTLNLNVGAGFLAFVAAAQLTEGLLRRLFREWRAQAAKEQSSLRTLDSEIFIVATLAGWLLCDCVSNPFVVSPRAFQAADSTASSALRADVMRSNVASAMPEHVVGRSLLVASWLAIVLFATLLSPSGNAKTTAKMGLPMWLVLLALTGVISLALTGWQCAYCFNESAAVSARIAEEQAQLAEAATTATPTATTASTPPSEDSFFVMSLPLQQRLRRVAAKLRFSLKHSLTFQNPLVIWKRLLVADSDATAASSSSSSTDTILRLRLGWIGVFLVTLPVFAAFPFLLAQVQPALHRAVPRIVWRKWFHFVAVAVFLLPTFVDPRLMSMAWQGALGLFALVELARFCAVPPFAAVTPLLESVTDDRDALVIRTHWYLMLGCALPVIATQRTAFFWAGGGAGATEGDALHWAAIAALRIVPGLGCLGIGDALSAVVGTLMGRAPTSKWAALFNPVGYYEDAENRNSSGSSNISSSSGNRRSATTASASARMATPQSPIVRKNPVLEHKSLAGTLLGGCALTFVLVVVCLGFSRLVTDKFLLGQPLLSTRVLSSFVVHGSVVETAKLFGKLAAVVCYGAVFETVASGVDNLELPLAAMTVSYLLW